MESSLKESGTELKETLKLKSSALGVKILESEDSIPEGAKRPVKDLGYHLSVCQGFTIARRQGMTIAMLKEDMWCFYPVIGFGIEKPVEYFLEGKTRFPGMASTIEAGKAWAKDFPYLKKKSAGIAFAPLELINFVPDVVLIYCDSIQAYSIVKALTWKTGVDLPIQPRLCPIASCVYSVVGPLISTNYSVTFPDGGERTRGMANDDEITFGLKFDFLTDLMEGIRHAPIDKFLHKSSPLTAIPEYGLNAGNLEVGRQLGLNQKV